MEALESRRLFSATPSLNLDSRGFVSAAGKGNAKLPYSYSVTGNAGNTSPTLSAQSAGLAIAGGGLDVDEVFKWMGAKVTGPTTPVLTRSIGDFLVIRATGTNAYNSYINQLVPDLDSVATSCNAIARDATWQALFTEELNRWASTSGNLLSFIPRHDNGDKSGTGLIQNDPNFGDIRIGGHRFDGAGGVLAHAYYPPGTNNNSYACDAHFASEETWVNGDPLTTGGSPVGWFAELVHTAEGDFYKCNYAQDIDDHATELAANPIFQGLMANYLSSLGLDSPESLPSKRR